jgi:HTH-like domain
MLRSWTKTVRRPGSLGRPRRCRRDLPTREEQSGQIPYLHDVPYAWGFYQRVLCLDLHTPCKRKQRDIILGDRIEAIHRRSRNTYGRPRIKAELKDDGIAISNDRLARLMNERQVQGASRRKGIRTTVRDRDARPAPDLVDRKFVAEAPNKLWVADISVLQQHGRELGNEFRLTTMREAAWKMEAGPPRSACRGGSQTTLNGIG